MIKNQFVAEWTKAKLVTEPGESFSYNNGGYALLGLIIEVVSGESYGMYMKSALFEPLQMTGTITAEHGDVSLQGYSAMFGFNVPRSEVTSTIDTSAGSMISTASDVSKFLQFQLTGLDAKGRELLSPGSLSTLHTPLNPIRSEAQGFMVEHYGDVATFGHNGDLLSFAAKTVVIPQSNRTITLLMNKNHLGVTTLGLNSLMADLVHLLEKTDAPSVPWVKWAVKFYPIIMLLDFLSNAWGIRKIKSISSGELHKLNKSLLTSSTIATLLFGLPVILSFFMNRGVDYKMIWGMAPDLLIFVLASATLYLVKSIIVVKKRFFA